MPRLLAVTHDFTLTGAPIALYKLMVSLRDRFEIHLVSHCDGLLRDLCLETGIKASVVSNVHTDLRACEEILPEYDGLIANTLLSMVAMQTAVKIGKPSLWIVHEGLDWQHMMGKCAPSLPACLELATRLASPCQFGRRLYYPWRRKPIDVVPWGIEAMTPPPPSRSNGKFNLLILGSIQRRKGQDIALEAMRILGGDNIMLQIIGVPDAPEFYQRIIGQYVELRNVLWRGAVPRAQVAQAISDCDVLIVPSRDELTPLVILEAMALGKPVIASDVGGIPEMIEDGINGYIFPTEDSAELARLIKRLARDPELGREMGAKGREFVLKHRTHEQCADQYAVILNEMLALVAAAR